MSMPSLLVLNLTVAKEFPFLIRTPCITTAVDVTSERMEVT
jgi:hypothetical protein